MLERFIASNGIVIEHSAVVRTVAILKDGETTDLVTTLLHQHFDEGTFRNMYGTLDKETYIALGEFCDSLGITKMKRGRKDGYRKTIQE